MTHHFFHTSIKSEGINKLPKLLMQAASGYTALFKVGLSGP